MKHARIAYDGAIHQAATMPGDDSHLRLADGRVLHESEVVWLPPVVPRTVFALGLNYADHAKELAFKAPEEPLAFLKGPNTLIGHRAHTVRPAGVAFMHYECELVVVIGDRTDAQRRAIELGAGILVISNGARPDGEVLRLAEEKGTSVVLSPLDSYVTSRMIQLSVPCWEVMSENPLTVHPDDLITDITQQVMEVHYRAAIAVDDDKVPIGIVSRTDLVSPEPRKVLLVDHAEVGQSVEGVERAQIVEILDHHHIGDIETSTPIPATFDPVGSTATLIVERFRERGLEPERSTAMMLLAAVLSDTVILNSPTTTQRDHEVVRYLEEFLGLDAREFGMEMFEASSDVSSLSAEEIVTRDAKEYGTSGGDKLCIAQVETVGKALLERKGELLEALERMREQRGYVVAALMVTDIVERGTELLCVGDRSIVERAFGSRVEDSSLNLPGVMSRKKQVAPKILAAA